MKTTHEVVAHWLLQLWVRRPSWLASMPDEEAVDQLVKLIDEERPIVRVPLPLNVQIAEALKWRVWEDLRPGCEGNWFMERDGRPGFIEVRPVPNYIAVLRDALKMYTGDKMPSPGADQFVKPQPPVEAP